MTTEVGSLISAGSVLLAILGILFSLWYSEISETQNLKPTAHYEDDVGKASRVHAVFKTKAIPLSAAASVVGFLLLPDALEIVAHAAEVVFTDLEGDYDAVSATQQHLWRLRWRRSPSLATARYWHGVCGDLKASSDPQKVDATDPVV